VKTAVLRLVQKLQAEGKELPVADIAASFQHSVARSLTKRAIACAIDHNLDTIAIGGGVAANRGLRATLQAAASQRNIKVLFPPMEYCTDNAAMIGCAAAEHLNRGHISPLDLGVQSRLSIMDVMSLYSILSN
jgi:N6-L-threonylcarbamoyladenine synthase